MKYIDHLIPDQGFEKIRDQISAILICEFKNQSDKLKNPHTGNVKFFASRIVPITSAEESVINISLWKGEYSNKDVDYRDGTYRFAIDIITNAKTKGDKPGDTLAAIKMEKLTGIVTYILEHSVNETLQFERPFILHTELTMFQVIKYDNDGHADVSGSAQSQAIFTVRCGEYTTPPAGNVVKGTITDVRLEQTTNGYQYIVNY